jgi:Helix-turn-helix domain
MTHDRTSGQDVLLTVKEAAAFLRISPNTLNWQRSHGGGPAYVRVGRSIRYRLSDLLAHAAPVAPKSREA